MFKSAARLHSDSQASLKCHKLDTPEWRHTDLLATSESLGPVGVQRSTKGPTLVRRCHGQALCWELGDLGSVPGCGADLLCDFD